MVVWISGPTGSGKSSLSRILGALAYAVVEEKIPKEHFHAFVSDPTRNCAPLQEQIMRSRFREWQRQSSASRILFDRSLDEDAQVFCRMHHDLGLLDAKQYKRLQTLASDLQSQMPRPDLIVFMCPKQKVLFDRVKATEHPSIIVKNLDRQVSIYNGWLSTRREAVLRLDNSACDLQAVQRLFLEIPQC